MGDTKHTVAYNVGELKGTQGKNGKNFKRYIDKHQNEVYIAFHEKAKASLMSRAYSLKVPFFDVMIRTDRIDRQKEDKTYVVRR